MSAYALAAQPEPQTSRIVVVAEVRDERRRSSAGRAELQRLTSELEQARRNAQQKSSAAIGFMLGLTYADLISDVVAGIKLYRRRRQRPYGVASFTIEPLTP